MSLPRLTMDAIENICRWFIIFIVCGGLAGLASLGGHTHAEAGKVEPEPTGAVLDVASARTSSTPVERVGYLEVPVFPREPTADGWTQIICVRQITVEVEARE